VKSCERFNIKPGIYASVTANGYLEVDNPGLVNRGRGGDPAKQAAYAQTCEEMLSELWGGMATSSISGLTGVLCNQTKAVPTCYRCFTSSSPTPTSLGTGSHGAVGGQRGRRDLIPVLGDNTEPRLFRQRRSRRK